MPSSSIAYKPVIILFAFCILNIMANNNSPQNSPDLHECCLIGRLLSNKPIHFKSMRNTLSSVWKPDRKVEISQMDTNRFMFQFFVPEDIERIFQTGPWLFDSSMLVTRKISFRENPATMPPDKTEIWVQLHNLPFGFMTETIGVLIGNHIGRFVKYDFENNCGLWRRFMHIRVEINVLEPLKQNWAFEREDAEADTVDFKYERLGNFCYVYGILGHTHNFCSKKFCGSGSSSLKKWGPTLRAEFHTNTGSLEDNQWLRDNGPTGGADRRNEEHVQADIFHKMYGKVKIGRNVETRLLTFAQHFGATFNSNEWIYFDLLSKAAYANTHTPAQNQQQMSFPTITGTQPVMQNTDAEGARIDRLIQKARLKNPIMIEGAPEQLTLNSPILNPAQPISQLATTLTKVVHVSSKPSNMRPKAGKGKASFKIVDTGEALGLLTVLRWVKDLQLWNMDFEVDSKTVVDSIYGKHMGVSNFSAIINDCCHLLCTDLTNSDVKFIWRQVNESAHSLARKAPSEAGFHVFYNIPTCIESILINEMH